MKQLIIRLEYLDLVKDKFQIESQTNASPQELVMMLAASICQYAQKLRIDWKVLIKDMINNIEANNVLPDNNRLKISDN